MSYPAGGNFLRLDCGVKQWVYISVATKLCCTVALLCGAVLLCYCSSPLLELQHELLHHGLHCGVKQWVYTSVATKLCCSGALLCGALLCGAVLLCYCSSPVLELQHELLHHGLHCGVKQWVYTSVATKLCCTVALLCGAVWCCTVELL